MLPIWKTHGVRFNKNRHRTRDSKEVEVLKPKDIYGDVELEDGSALMPPITHICQKGMKPNSPNQARGRECVGVFFVCVFSRHLYILYIIVCARV